MSSDKTQSYMVPVTWFSDSGSRVDGVLKRVNDADVIVSGWVLKNRYEQGAIYRIGNFVSVTKVKGAGEGG